MNPDENIPPVIEYSSHGGDSRPPTVSEVFAGTCAVIIGLCAFLFGLFVTVMGILFLFAKHLEAMEGLTLAHRVASGIGTILLGVLTLLFAKIFFQIGRQFFANKNRPQ